jgi:hypothetical protein
MVNVDVCSSHVPALADLFLIVAENAEHTNGPGTQPPLVDAAHFSGWYLNLKMRLLRQVFSAHPPSG